MSKPPAPVTEVQSRFAALNLHDARFVQMRIERAQEQLDDRVVLLLQLVDGPNADSWADAEMSFLGCASVLLGIDLWNKRLGGDAINDAHCQYDEAWIDDLSKEDPARQRSQRLEYILKFRIVLCPPAGELTIYARDFKLRAMPRLG